MRKRILILCLFFAVCGSAKAAGPPVLPAQYARSDYRVVLAFKQRLGLSPHEPILISRIKLPGVYGSHLRIRYRSAAPVPLKFAPVYEAAVDDYSHQFLTAVLPPAEDGDVLLPLLQSSMWKPNGNGVLLFVYARAGAEPEKITIEAEDRATAWDRFAAYLHHPLQSEIFTISSINYLYGYRVADISLSLIVSALGFAAFFILLAATGRPFRSLALSAALAMILYSARFTVDLLSTTMRDAYRWEAFGTFREVGDLYSLAGRLREISGSSPQPMRVAACMPFATMLRYFLFPAPVGSGDEAWKAATHGALMGIWEERDGIVACGGHRRQGTVIATFPEGGAIVRFDPAT